MSKPFQIPQATLELDQANLRQLGYAIIDAMVDHYDHMEQGPVTATRPRHELEAKLREPIPTSPTDPETVLKQALEDVFANNMVTAHPRFFAFVPGPSNSVSALADMLASGFNAFAGTWLEASGAGMVEVVTLDWLAELIGYDTAHSGGIFTSGGSMANLTALHTARHHHLGTQDEHGVIYYSNQTHSSVDRATRVIGLQPGQVRKLPTDSAFRLELSALREAVHADRAAGHQPFCVVANAGTTNTGAIDPLPELAAFCQQENIWLHVDGAYGAAAVITERGQALLEGIHLADSVTIDPHKWLFQPYEIGCLLVKDAAHLKNAYSLIPEYLQDTDQGDEHINFYNRGVQLTRGFRALKLWMSLKVFGLDAFRAAVDWGFRQAEIVASQLADNPNWQVITGPHMGIVNFRYVPVAHALSTAQLNTLQQQVANAMVASGYAMLATTILNGQTVLRLITINPRTTETHLITLVEQLTALGEDFTAYRVKPS